MREILEMLKNMMEHELAVSQLYKTYAIKLPEMREFWLELGQEEMQHADPIQALVAQVERGNLAFSSARIPPAGIRSSLEYVQKKIRAVLHRDITAVNAVGVALDLGKSVVEKKYFAVIDTDPPEVKRTFSALAQGYRQHLEKFRDLRDKMDPAVRVLPPSP